MTAMPGDDLDDDSTVVVLPGDAPLLRPETLDELVAAHVANDNAVTMLDVGVGRPDRLRPDRPGQPTTGCCASSSSVMPPARSASIREVCTSIYAFRRDLLGPALRHLSPDNAQGEYYLTDVVGSLAGMGHRVDCVTAPADETQGVNDRWQLALAERELRARTNRHWLLNGVTMLDPRQTFIDVTVDLGRDVTLYPGTMLHGSTVVGNRCEIGPNTRLIDCKVGERATIQYSVGTSASIGAGARVGPYAALDPGTVVAAEEVTGAFYTAQQ